MNNNEVYVLTEDTPSILEAMGVDVADPQVQRAIGIYSMAVESIITDTFKSKVDLYREPEINSSLSGKVQEALDEDPSALVICLDRFLLSDIEKNSPTNFTRFSVTRMYDGSKGSRIGQPTAEEQIAQLAEVAKDRNLIIVDDGIFTGSTVKYVMDQLELLNGSIGKVKAIGYIGTPFMSDESLANLEVEIINQYEEGMIDWIDLRDFGIFGGKLVAKSKGGNIGISKPYILPFEETGNPISLDTSTLEGRNKYRMLSSRMLFAQSSLLLEIETITGKSLRIRDLISSGFGIPSLFGVEFKPWVRDKEVVGYLIELSTNIILNEA